MNDLPSSHSAAPGGRRTLRLAADPAGIGAAAAILRDGGLVAFPTETVYGLGADATSGPAVAGIYEAKGRPRFNPLIVHVADLAAARAIGRFDRRALDLAKAFWPGPLTLVVPREAGCPVSDLALAGHDTVAIRVPAHPAALALLAAAGRPVCAPSANRSGHVSPTDAAHVAADLDGRIDAILDGGPCPVGVESTILLCVPGGLRILRPGGLDRAAIEAVAGPIAVRAPEGTSPDRAIAPGMLASHYAPSSPVRLNARSVAPGEHLLAFGPTLPSNAGAAALILNLSAAGDLTEAAANLFGHLRRLDAGPHVTIAVMPVPDQRLGEAINDRLARAAAERP